MSDDLGRLSDVLERATDRVEAPGLAAGALAIAHRRRRARQGALASAAAAVLVAGVLLGTRMGGSGSVEPAPAPTETPAGPIVSTAPPIRADRIQPVWDPRDAESRPVVELGVPRVMESLVPGEVEQPVALLDDGSRVLLVSAEGRSAELELPAGAGRWRTVSLSPDGSRLAVAGMSGFFWRALDGGWQRVAVDDEQQVTGQGVSITWAPDSRSLVLRSHLAGVRVDLDSGELTPLATLGDYTPWSFTPEGGIVTVRGSVEWGDTGDRALLGPLEGLQSPAVGESALAAARVNLASTRTTRDSDFDGLIAVDRRTLATRSFLPVPGPERGAGYGDLGSIAPVAWLDDDTVLFTVLPQDAPKEYLMTWDVETGGLSRVSCWLEEFDAVFATDLMS